MSDPSPTSLHDQATAVQFYQQRFSKGYMEDWPDEKKDKIAQIVRSLDLPPSGEALDFGCGNGALTELLRQTLPPGWKMYGADVSPKAIDNAKAQFPRCRFFTHDGPPLNQKKFDFLFTHHVLEHVYDFQAVLKEINGRLKSSSTMLHILPCGNNGSFEHRVCLLRKDGIDPKLENRFFFEDEGHLRRLTSAQLAKLVQATGFMLEKEYYTCHYFGAIDWITRAGPDFVRMFTNPSSAKSYQAKLKLIKLHYKLLLISKLRSIVTAIENHKSPQDKNFKNQLHQILLTLIYPIAKPVDLYWKIQSRNEWRFKKNTPNGSEMFLIFKR
jgi:SAM-dependent methyltransferase